MHGMTFPERKSSNWQSKDQIKKAMIRLALISMILQIPNLDRQTDKIYEKVYSSNTKYIFICILTPY